MPGVPGRAAPDVTTALHGRSARYGVIVLALVMAAALGACGRDDETAAGSRCFDPPSVEPLTPDAVAETDVEGTTVRVLTHGSFAISDDVLAGFEASSGIDVEFVESPDTGAMVSQAILTAGDPVADVVYGVDNTFLCRALEQNLFVPYSSPRLAAVPAELRLDPHDRVSPIDYGDVCINWWTDRLGTPLTSLDDLRQPEVASQWVTMSPETSSPGLAILLATVARYGDDWTEFWRDASAGGMSVTADWTSGYFGEFVAGGGDRAVVTSYATSPVAEVLFAEPAIDAAPTSVLDDGCFRQIEFAGILDGTSKPAAAARVVDFLLSTEFQSDVPLQMFVFPAVTDAAIPPVFLDNAVQVTAPVMIDPADIEAHRDEWVDEWRRIVVG
ncbi:MAG: thiamine ABC transporter substrate-binding protein [Acidimicrobiales bacterium]|nr:thiamine ABC transporter substrate-binding protein [Acidimicrobiales bacterium]